MRHELNVIDFDSNVGDLRCIFSCWLCQFCKSNNEFDRCQPTMSKMMSVTSKEYAHQKWPLHRKLFLCNHRLGQCVYLLTVACQLCLGLHQLCCIGPKSSRPSNQPMVTNFSCWLLWAACQLFIHLHCSCRQSAVPLAAQ